MYCLFRIRRDYAEHGTCSPGDDVFGDEAVGAVVAGRPTGMHPVVATCLQNLRILEVNAQGRLIYEEIRCDNTQTIAISLS